MVIKEEPNNMSTQKTKRFLVLILILSLVLSGCRGEAKHAPTATPLPTATATSTKTPVPPTKTPVPTQASITNGYTSLYSGPSTVFDVVKNIDIRAALEIIGIDPTGEWAKVTVSASGKTGWIPLKDITLNEDIKNYPVDYNIPPTPIPPAACFSNCSSITISNDTGGPLSILVAGGGMSVDSKWSVVVGTETIDLKPGAYTVTATASCGSKTDVVALTQGVNQSFSYFCSTIP